LLHRIGDEKILVCGVEVLDRPDPRFALPSINIMASLIRGDGLARAVRV